RLEYDHTQCVSGMGRRHGSWIARKLAILSQRLRRFDSGVSLDLHAQPRRPRIDSACHYDPWELEAPGVDAIYLSVVGWHQHGGNRFPSVWVVELRGVRRRLPETGP